MARLDARRQCDALVQRVVRALSGRRRIVPDDPCGQHVEARDALGEYLWQVSTGAHSGQDYRKALTQGINQGAAVACAAVWCALQ